MSTQTYFGTLTVMTCGKCGVVFGMEESHRAECQRTGGTFYCPNGHAIVYRETESMRLSRELEYAKRRAASAEGRATRLEYRRRAAVGQVTKIKKRVANGVCPCCQRTFRDLAAHMADKHPDYASEAP